MNKRLVLSIILIIFINNLGLVNCVELCSPHIVSNSNSIQMPLWELFYSIKKPVTILNNFVIENCPLYPQYKPAKNTSKNETNTSSDYFILSAKKKQELRKDNTFNKKLFISQNLISNDILINKNPSRDREPINFLCLFLLTYIIVLLKSNLPWSIILSLLNKLKNPTYHLKLGFLFTGENNETN